MHKKNLASELERELIKSGAYKVLVIHINHFYIFR
jgi:hypothetical protein